MSAPFVHRVRPRYAEVDQQGVVFNAHWLTYFDDACTRFFEALGYTPNEAFFGEFDVMIVKAVLEWEGPGRLRRARRHRGRAGPARHEVVRPALPGVDRRACRVHRRDHLRERQAVDARVERRYPTGSRANLEASLAS